MLVLLKQPLRVVPNPSWHCISPYALQKQTLERDNMYVCTCNLQPATVKDHERIAK